MINATIKWIICIIGIYATVTWAYFLHYLAVTYLPMEFSLLAVYAITLLFVITLAIVVGLFVMSDYLFYKIDSYFR